MLNITTDATETMNTKYTCHVNTDIDGVNQICESTDQKNSLQCVNQDLHVAHEYASRTAEFERPSRVRTQCCQLTHANCISVLLVPKIFII